jgi:hypothetical protein
MERAINYQQLWRKQMSYVPAINVATAELHEISQFIYNHLKQQGEQSVRTLALSGISNCMYRQRTSSGKTLMCAVGCLIPDSVYTDDLEGKAVYSDLVLSILGLDLQLPGRGNLYLLLSQWQEVHDNCLAEPSSYFMNLDYHTKEIIHKFHPTHNFLEKTNESK